MLIVHRPPSTTLPLPIPQHPRGARIDDIPTDIISWDGWRPLDWINTAPAPPLGWYSVFHWIALTEPGVFRHFCDPAPTLFHAEQEEAKRLTRAEGSSPIEWPAPRKMQEAGIKSVWLIPDPILRDLFREP